MHSALSVLVVAALAAVANAQSLNVVNSCTEDIFLYTATSDGKISPNIVAPAGKTTDMGISTDWDGAISAGEQR